MAPFISAPLAVHLGDPGLLLPRSKRRVPCEDVDDHSTGNRQWVGVGRPQEAAARGLQPRHRPRKPTELSPARMVIIIKTHQKTHQLRSHGEEGDGEGEGGN